jgi:hypothetical protein
MFLLDFTLLSTLTVFVQQHENHSRIVTSDKKLLLAIETFQKNLT